MKRILLAAAFFAATIPAFAQKTAPEHVPEPVLKSFNTTFPGAQSVQWELDEENYEVSFSEKKLERSARFDRSGKWLQTETAMKVSQQAAESCEDGS